MNKKRNRGLPVKSEGLKLIETKMREQGYSSREKLAEATELSTKTIDKIFNPKMGNPERKTIEAIANVLDLDPGDIVKGWYPANDKSESKITNSEAVEKLLNNPRQVCREVFISTKKRLTTNPLTNKDDTTFDYKDVCISLGLMERKKQRKIHKDFPTNAENNEYEITTKFEQSKFFTEVLAQGNSPKSQGKKIAIIGEPGAGKTTQLQTIADWIFGQTEDVAIWISLADLKDKSIREYLLKVWLNEAFKKERVTPDVEDALVELFNQGRVWLLLDGVDEMGVKNPLQFINSQISGWVASARIILTCRLNVWDVGKNYLESFDVYRNLDFDSEQIKEFIGKWFVKNSELGKNLQNELEKSGKERIRDLIKNPLRLTLLCWFWQRRQGSFPETKAGLYKRFVEVFYEWKEWEPDPFATQSEARENLKVALGKLAVKAIDKNSSRFRLSHREVCQVLGNFDTPLFKLVIKLGWLNKVGVAEENPDEEVYAFFHATFQEYFAALAISEWDFFLNHNNENPNPFLKHNGKDCVYRIFESHWQEVLLLWLGRDDVEDKKKDELMLNLVEFKDGFQNFYSKNSNLLHIANEARGEFRKCFLNTMHWWYVDDNGPNFWEEFNNYVIELTDEPYWNPDYRNLGFYFYFNHFTDIFSWSEIQKRLGTYMYKIRDKQVENFKKELKIRAENVEKELKNLEDSFLSRFGIIPEFKGFKAGNSGPNFTKESINTILQFTDLQSIQTDLSKYGFLQYTSPVIMIVISALDKDKELISERKIYDENHKIIDLLKQHLSEEIDYINQLEDIDLIIQKIGKIRSNCFMGACIRGAAINRLLDIDIDKVVKITHLINKIYQTNNNVILLGIIYILHRLDIEDPKQISDKIHAMNYLVKTNNDQFILMVILMEILSFLVEDDDNNNIPSQIKLDLIKNIIANQNNVGDCKTFPEAFNKLLAFCAQNMTYPDFYAWHSNNSTVQNLENQITDISKQLKPNTKTHPIFIDTSPLKDETDTEAIAQEIYNQIHQTIYSNDDNIPEVNNAPQLKRLIPKIKNHLHTKHLSLILHKSNPHPETIAFCHKLTNALHIGWLTDLPLEPPLRGFPPNQPNLKSALETWLNEIGD